MGTLFEKDTSRPAQAGIDQALPMILHHLSIQELLDNTGALKEDIDDIELPRVWPVAIVYLEKVRTGQLTPMFFRFQPRPISASNAPFLHGNGKFPASCSPPPQRPVPVPEGIDERVDPVYVFVTL